MADASTPTVPRHVVSAGSVRVRFHARPLSLGSDYLAATTRARVTLTNVPDRVHAGLRRCDQWCEITGVEKATPWVLRVLHVVEEGTREAQDVIGILTVVRRRQHSVVASSRAHAVQHTGRLPAPDTDLLSDVTSAFRMMGIAEPAPHQVMHAAELVRRERIGIDVWEMISGASARDGAFQSVIANLPYVAVNFRVQCPQVVSILNGDAGAGKKVTVLAAVAALGPKRTAGLGPVRAPGPLPQTSIEREVALGRSDADHHPFPGAPRGGTLIVASKTTGSRWAALVRRALPGLTLLAYPQLTRRDRVTARNFASVDIVVVSDAALVSSVNALIFRDMPCPCWRTFRPGDDCPSVGRWHVTSDVRSHTCIVGTDAVRGKTFQVTVLLSDVCEQLVASKGARVVIAARAIAEGLTLVVRQSTGEPLFQYEDGATDLALDVASYTAPCWGERVRSICTKCSTRARADPFCASWSRNTAHALSTSRAACPEHTATMAARVHRAALHHVAWSRVICDNSIRMPLGSHGGAWTGLSIRSLHADSFVSVGSRAVTHGETEHQMASLVPRLMQDSSSVRALLWRAMIVPSHSAASTFAARSWNRMRFARVSFPVKEPHAKAVVELIARTLREADVPRTALARLLDMAHALDHALTFGEGSIPTEEEVLRIQTTRLVLESHVLDEDGVVGDATCPICFGDDPLNRVVTLPCNHSLCLTCAEEATARRALARCPKCRESVTGIVRVGGAPPDPQPPAAPRRASAPMKFTALQALIERERASGPCAVVILAQNKKTHSLLMDRLPGAMSGTFRQHPFPHASCVLVVTPSTLEYCILMLPAELPLRAFVLNVARHRTTFDAVRGGAVHGTCTVELPSRRASSSPPPRPPQMVERFQDAPTRDVVVTGLVLAGSVDEALWEAWTAPTVDRTQLPATAVIALRGRRRGGRAHA